MPILVGMIVSPVLSITIVMRILNHANVNHNNILKIEWNDIVLIIIFRRGLKNSIKDELLRTLLSSNLSKLI